MSNRLASFIDKLGGAEHPNPYTIKLRPAEVILMLALEKHPSIDIRKMTGIDINSVRVQMSRLRKKLPKGVKIETIYGGYYSLTPESKELMKKYRKVKEAA